MEIKDLEEVLKTLGPPKSFDLLERKEQDHQRVYTYRAAFADATYDVQFSLEAENRIAALAFKVD